MTSKQFLALIGVAVLSVVVTSLVITMGLFGAKDTTGPKDRKDIVIDYAVGKVDGVDKLVIVTNTSGKCTGGVDKGCFKVKKSKNGAIKFEFTTADGWDLKQFTICSGMNEITNSCTVDLTLDERLEFFVMNNKAGDQILLTPPDGQVDLTQLGDDVKIFYLFDQNTIKQDYYYNIKACPTGSVDDSGCLYLDPPIENRGRD